MYKKHDKRRLYWLLDRYLLSEMDEATFCDEFYYAYDLEIEKSKLTDLELNAFAELSKVSSRFSKYSEDHNLDTNAFSTRQDLEEAIIEAKTQLDKQFNK